MNNSDFSKSKIGDKVWNPMEGYGIIEKISIGGGILYVRFDAFNTEERFTNKGKRLYRTDAAPTLFHRKPECFKQKVEKTVELNGWYCSDVNHFDNDTENNDRYGYVPARAVITYTEED